MQLISVQLAVCWRVDCQAVQRHDANGADVCGLPISQCHTRDEERECSRAGVNSLGYGHADQHTDVAVDLPDIAARELQGLLQILVGEIWLTPKPSAGIDHLQRPGPLSA